MTEIRLPAASLVVLIGPSGAGKSTWARQNFVASQIVSSDQLRALTGASDGDQRAGTDAFAVLDAIVAARLRRKLTTVVDTMGFDDERRRQLIADSHAAGMKCVAVVFDASPSAIEERNAASRWPLPKRVLAGQRKRFQEVRSALPSDGFDAIYSPGRVRIVPPGIVASKRAAQRQSEQALPMRFGLQISNFTWQDGSDRMGNTLAEIAQCAEHTGFSSIWVMDHFRQIPQVGPEWHDMPESYTTLAFLAGVTSSATLGTLVTGVGYRNPAHLGKIVATLDVLSGGRAVCGIGLGWFEKEARGYGWEFPPVSDRYALLEDTLQLLPVIWGPGNKEFQGRVLRVPDTMCYPRPIRDTIPILIGGAGEQRTLRLVARYADMCNLFGDAETVRHKVTVLRKHCEDVDRDPSEIEVTHLSQAVTAPSSAALEERLERWRSPSETVTDVAETVGGATIQDQIGRYRELAEAGVEHAIVAMRDASDLEALAAFGEVIAAFR